MGSGLVFVLRFGGEAQENRQNRAKNKTNTKRMTPFRSSPAPSSLLLRPSQSLLSSRSNFRPSRSSLRLACYTLPTPSLLIPASFSLYPSRLMTELGSRVYLRLRDASGVALNRKLVLVSVRVARAGKAQLREGDAATAKAWGEVVQQVPPPRQSRGASRLSHGCPVVVPL